MKLLLLLSSRTQLVWIVLFALITLTFSRSVVSSSSASSASSSSSSSLDVSTRQAPTSPSTPTNNNNKTGGIREEKEDPFASGPTGIVSLCDKRETYGKFDTRNCEKLRIIVTLSARTDKQKLEIREAILILLYFGGLSLMMFSLVTIIRIHAIGVRSKYAIRACWVFGIGLLFVAILMPIIRTLLQPFDAEVLGVTSSTSDGIMRCCAGKPEIEWPTTSDTSVMPLIQKPYLGEPPRNYWPFWLVVAASFGTAISLAATLIYLRMEETRGVGQTKSGLPVYQCGCGPDDDCVHSPQP